MTSGFDCGYLPGEQELLAMFETPNWVQSVLDLPMRTPQANQRLQEKIISVAQAPAPVNPAALPEMAEIISGKTYFSN
ncbi:hypothetical protein PN36_16695 [Candidatus Thiomargarita nelsonii]|uniref:Uncharacterized protein n=1 Tax=Candidatus Thiomargarita nelsonii TaxID=1003181 RepID=A0A0A6PIB1_9GAMM|nr:hypothetical protein PN36_16695 [Candidatus Thiomargarita nelsonii]